MCTRLTLGSRGAGCGKAEGIPGVSGSNLATSVSDSPGASTHATHLASLDAVTIVRPSGEKAPHVTLPPCP